MSNDNSRRELIYEGVGHALDRFFAQAHGTDGPDAGASMTVNVTEDGTCDISFSSSTRVEVK